ncbi:MAG: hypothetical protein WC325_13195 [Candidatus Bathyarchaeia archaeon]|jgi:hypothetical protein
MTKEENIKFLTKLVNANDRVHGYIFSRLSPIIFREDFQGDMDRIRKQYPTIPNLHTEKDKHAGLMKELYDVSYKYNLEKNKVGFFFLNWDDVLKDYLYFGTCGTETPFKIVKLKDINFKDASFVLAINPLATQDEIIKGIEENWFWISRFQEKQLSEEGGEDYDWSKLSSIQKKSNKFRFRPRPFFERDVEIYELHNQGLSSTEIHADTKYNLEPKHIRKIIADMKKIFEPEG